MTTIPPESFRISVLGKWFLVHIAETVDDMQATMKGHVGGCHPQQLACVVSIDSYDESLTGCIGFIFMPRDHLGSGLVAHELAHAAFRVCDVIGLRVAHWERPLVQFRAPSDTTTSPSEESFCSMLETLTQKFWTKVYECGYA